MTPDSDETPHDYVVAHVEAAFAEDPGVAELGLEAAVIGDRLFLRGHVSSAEQRARAAEVAARIAPQLEVCNELDVVPAPEPTEAEHLQ